MTETAEHKIETEQCARTHKAKEVAVVATANAIVDPHAMMILGFDTTVADSAVMTSRWAPYIAGLAVFSWDVQGSIESTSGFNRGPLRQRWWYSEGII